MEEYVVLVNPKDEVLGLMEKQQAHINGLLHRAFSVFLFNDNGEMLLQKRSSEKYHSPNQWTNAVCSHPRDGETYLEGAKRRLREELGIETELSEKFNLNKNEVEEVRYISLKDLDKEIAEHPDQFTEWFKIILEEYKHNF